MNKRMQRGAALTLTAALLLSGSAGALFGFGREKAEPIAPEDAPTVRAMEVRTYRGIPYQGTLEASDPAGLEVTFSIVEQPEKGTVALEGAEFVYTPGANAVGTDRFTYAAINSNGVVSSPAVVNVTIQRPKSGITYSDTGTADAAAAQYLAEEGIFTGAKLGEQWFFEPERTVSRGEFLAMVLETTDADVTAVSMTGFSDDDVIPTWARSYAAAGVAEGLIQGRPAESGTVFSCDAPISRSEAATVLNRALDMGDVELEVWYADREAVPSWAAQAVGNMEALNVLQSGSFGSGELERSVTRAEAARMLTAAGTLLHGETRDGLLSWLR